MSVLNLIYLAVAGLVGYGMFHVARNIHNGLRSYFTRHQGVDRVVEGKLHISAMGVALFVVAASIGLLTMPWLVAYPLLKLIGYGVAVLYIGCTLHAIVRGYQRFRGGNGNPPATPPTTPPTTR